MQRSEQIGQLAAALSAAQGMMRNAVKDSENPHFRYSYADLASCWDAAREALSKNGLSVLQPCSAKGDAVTVTTILAHSSGEWLSEDLTLQGKDASPQSVGSAISYARRYALSAVVGIAQADDDANAAQPQQAAPQQQRRAQAPRQAARHVVQQQPDDPEPTQAEKARALADAAERLERDKRIFDEAMSTGLSRDGFHAWAERAIGRPYGGNADWTEDDRCHLEEDLLARREAMRTIKARETIENSNGARRA